MINRILKIGYYVIVAAILGVALLLTASLLPITGNYKIKVVLSGSMEPAIKTGSIVVIKPTDLYKVGDIITFGKDTKKDIPTTHRIVEARAVEGEMIFTTKGDANNGNDASEVKENAVAGKVLFSAPYAGYLIDFAKKPVGFILLISIAAGCVVFDEVRKIWREIRKMKGKKEEDKKNEKEE